MKILTVCPSIHEDKLERMAESFYDTAEERNVLHVEREGNVTKAINTAFNKHPDFDFYHITNDDVIYKTVGWDTKLAQPWLISYGNDLLQGKNLCTFPMIDGDIVRALGWLQLPTLNKYCGDLVWHTIGKSLGNLSYHGNVLIKHHWSEEVDDKGHIEDQSEFAKWLQISHRDINKIREIICKKNATK